MSLNSILIATAVVGVVGLVIGILLGVAGKVFAVKVDEKEVKIREILPGNNCGGCGYPGCDGLAAAIAKGEAPADACPVGGAPVANGIADIMGTTVSAVKKYAYVACSGDCDKAKEKYNYYGNVSCKDASTIPGGGSKACSYGCLGLGSCVKVCEFDAIHIENGIAVVDKDKCKACGKCVLECPKHLISILDENAGYAVKCKSEDFGPSVNKVCSAGCIGCGICVKTCNLEAISLVNRCAVIDQDKCVKCGLCAQKCPKKVIEDIRVNA